MPATAPTVLARVMDALAENLAAVEVIAGGGVQLFGGDGVPANWDVPDGPLRGSRIYFQGEPVPDGGPFPLIVILFDDEEFEELDQTTKRGMILPYTLLIMFDLNPETEPDAHPTLRDIHTNLIGLVKDHLGLEANRGLPLAGYTNPATGDSTTVVDNTYDGGGAKLEPLDEDAEAKGGSARYSFALNYRLTYRHDPGDSKTPT